MHLTTFVIDTCKIFLSTGVVAIVSFIILNTIMVSFFAITKFSNGLIDKTKDTTPSETPKDNKRKSTQEDEEHRESIL